MPQKIICDKCEYVLYYGEDLVVPEDLIRQNSNQCPNCGKKLELDPGRIIISILR